MDQLIVSNINVYESIAEEAYAEMEKATKAFRTEKPDGGGWILRHDPNRASFKAAMVTIVFVGMWLEAFLHLEIVRRAGLAQYKKVDFSSYEEKLKLVGVDDQALLSKVAKFRKSRKELVHEKAYFDSNSIKVAQSEAELAHEVMLLVKACLG